MPPSEQKSEVINQRRNLICLLYQEGLTFGDIGRILSVSKTIVRYALRETLRSSPQVGRRENTKRFQAILQLYLKWFHSPGNQPLPLKGWEREIRLELEENLGVRNLIAELSIFTRMLVWVVRPIPPPEQAWIQRLLDDIFGPPAGVDIFSFLRSEWSKLRDRELPLPENARQLHDHLCRSFACSVRDHIQPNWPDNAERAMNQILASLHPREAQIVRSYYQDSKTLEAIGQEDGVSRERIRQLQAKTIRRLRCNPRRTKLEMQFLRSNLSLESPEVFRQLTEQMVAFKEEKNEMVKVLERESTLLGEITRLKAILATSEEIRSIVEREGSSVLERSIGNDVLGNPIHLSLQLLKQLRLKIDDLELSVRSASCLSYAKVETVGQLVQYKNEELLRLRNFGRRCLKEIQTILQEMGLGLGLKLPLALQELHPKPLRS